VAEESAEAPAEEEEGAEIDEKLAFRSVPSHFYPEAKHKDTKFAGTHTRFDDEGEQMSAFQCRKPAP